MHHGVLAPTRSRARSNTSIRDNRDKQDHRASGYTLGSCSSSSSSTRLVCTVGANSRASGMKRSEHNENENPAHFLLEDEEAHESQKRLRVLTSAFDFGEEKGHFDEGESCERTVRETVLPFYENLGRDRSTKAIADMDAKIMLMRFPSLSGQDAEATSAELLHPLLQKLSSSSVAGNREIAGALSTIMVQLELSRLTILIVLAYFCTSHETPCFCSPQTYQGLMFDTLMRLELGMRTAPSPRGGLSPPQSASAPVSKPECSKQQLDQLTVYIKQAVVRYFCKDVHGVRKKSSRSCFSMSVDSVSIVDAIRGLSSSALALYDHVTANYNAPARHVEVRMKCLPAPFFLFHMTGTHYYLFSYL